MVAQTIAEDSATTVVAGYPDSPDAVLVGDASEGADQVTRLDGPPGACREYQAGTGPGGTEVATIGVLLLPPRGQGVTNQPNEREAAVSHAGLDRADIQAALDSLCLLRMRIIRLRRLLRRHPAPDRERTVAGTAYPCVGLLLFTSGRQLFEACAIPRWLFPCGQQLLEEGGGEPGFVSVDAPSAFEHEGAVDLG